MSTERSIYARHCENIICITSFITLKHSGSFVHFTDEETEFQKG